MSRDEPDDVEWSLQRIGNLLDRIDDSLRAIALATPDAQCPKQDIQQHSVVRYCTLLRGHDGDHDFG